MAKAKNKIIRFKINALGLQVFVGGKWIPANDVVAENVLDILHQAFNVQQYL